jgi:hypothetical protein
MGLYDLYKKQPAKEHVAVYLSFDVMQQLVMYAEKLGTKVSPLIRIAVMEKLEELKKQFGEVVVPASDVSATTFPHTATPPAPPTPRSIPNPHEAVIHSQYSDVRASAEFQDRVVVDTSRAKANSIASGLRWD